MKALIVVDVQYDFLPGGSLAVPDGNEIIEPIERLQKCFFPIICTQDWHPKDHCSFAINGGIWPVHCVQNTHGAEIHKNILNAKCQIIQKGFHRDIDSYSGFWDNNRINKTGLDDVLKKEKIDTVYVCGLATDYCVKFTVLDALDSGYKTIVIKDACRGVNANTGDAENAFRSMQIRGAILVNHDEVIKDKLI